MIAEHLFQSFLAAFLLVLMLSLLVFYRYGILAEKEKSVTPESRIIFDEQSYQELSKIWQYREKKLTEGAVSDIKIRFAAPP